MDLVTILPTNFIPYVAKEDSICLFSIANKSSLNEQWIKPCVPFNRGSSREQPSVIYLFVTKMQIRIALLIWALPSSSNRAGYEQHPVFMCSSGTRGHWSEHYFRVVKSGWLPRKRIRKYSSFYATDEVEGRSVVKHLRHPWPEAGVKEEVWLDRNSQAPKTPGVRDGAEENEKSDAARSKFIYLEATTKSSQLSR